MAGQKLIFGTPVTVISLAATLANNAYTYAGLSGLTMTQLDNTTEAYPRARAVLGIPDTFANAPTANTVFNLYGIPEAIDSSNSTTPQADATAIKQAVFMGAFPIVAYDVAQRCMIVIDISGNFKWSFVLENKCGQTASYSSNPTTVIVTPFTLGT